MTDTPAPMRPTPPPLAELVDLLPEAVCVVDADGTVLYVNAAFPGILGYAGHEVLGRPIFELVHPDDRAATLEQARRVMGGGIQRHFRNRYLHKDGRSVDLLWSARWLPQYGVRLGIAREITELRRVQQELERRAHTDALTGLPNRRSLHDAFERLSLAATRAGAPLSVLYIDLDGFKRINDRLGHGAGDRVLEEVGRRLQAALRDGDLVARVGGDEFVALLPGCDHGAAGSVCSNLMASLQAPFSLSGRSVHLDASVGIGCYPRDGEALHALLAHADTAMYAVKRARKAPAAR